MAFSLEDEGHNWKIICQGDKRIGRVCQHADGSYIGLVGKYITVKGCRTEKEAFNEAVAQHLRYAEYTKRHHKEAAAKEKKRKPIITTGPVLRKSVVPYVAERFTATKAFMRPMFAS